jgi:hypothetical protein
MDQLAVLESLPADTNSSRGDQNYFVALKIQLFNLKIVERLTFE